MIYFELNSDTALFKTIFYATMYSRFFFKFPNDPKM